ncbi:MAG: alpha/beta hydrolase [Candidatus Hydrogenedentes bacterium]|nr:alpha/beta hydrolase [Candidatus Hydrogenedentota bacterium]
MKRWIVRILVALILLVMIVVGGACAMISYMSMPRDIPGVPRESLRIDDTRVISYFHAGSADAQRQIFIHGSPGSAGDWKRYLTNPMPGFETVAVDRPGFGATNPHTPVASLREQASAIEPFLVERNGKWPILIGHSLGGTIVCQAAVDYPDKVGGLVILAGALSPELETIHWYQSVAELRIVSAVLPSVLTTSNRELLPLKQELEKLAAHLGEIKCPVAIIHGNKDSLVPVGNVDYLRAKLSKSALTDVLIIPNENHFLPWTIESTVREKITLIAEK